MGLILGALEERVHFWHNILKIFCIFQNYFCLNNFSIKKREILINLIFDKICPRNYKTKLTYKLYPILGLNRCQQLADLIKTVFFWFVLTQPSKIFVQFFLDQTLLSYYVCMWI